MFTSTFIRISVITIICCFGLLGCSKQKLKAPDNNEGVISTDSITSNKLPPKSNIVFILADDLGYTDVTAFAEKVTDLSREDLYFETPNIDALADQGAAFTHAYVNPLCSPTRASLLTGKPAISLGFTTATSFRSTSYYAANQRPPVGQHALDVIEHKDNITIPQALINASTITGLYAGTELDNGLDALTYAEAMTEHRNGFLGKWHLGGHGTEGYQPSDQGFEELSFFDGGASGFFNFQKAWNAKRLFDEREGKPIRYTGKWDPLVKPPSSIKPYLTDALGDEAEAYLQARAQDQQPFTLMLSHFAVHAPIQARQDYIEYFSQKTNKGTKGQNNATYAAMVKSLDDSVGQIVRVLKETGLDKNTYVVFMSDNGGVDWLLKGDATAPTSNTPLTGGKATVYEGGVRVPLVIWHNNMLKQPNVSQDIDVSVDVTDIFPTLLELAGYGTDSYADIDNMAGQSLVPLLSDRANQNGTYSKDTIYWYYPFNVIVDSPQDHYPLTPHAAIKRKDHKLVVNYQGAMGLYNISEDASESNNVIESHSELAQSMFNELVSWIDKHAAPQYRPHLNPNYSPEKEVRVTPFNLLPGLDQVCCNNKLTESRSF